MKIELKIFIIFFLLFTFNLNPVSSLSPPRGYDVVHTRVKNGSFEIISFENDTDESFTRGVKLNYTFELWNPSTNNLTFVFDTRGSCVFLIAFNDSLVPYQITCGLFANQSSISLRSGITKINIVSERVYDLTYPYETPFELQDGFYNIKLKMNPMYNPSYPFGVSYVSSIEFTNNNSKGFEPNLPDNWGTINDSLPVALSTAITNAEFRFIHLNSSQNVNFRFIGESWNPLDEFVTTGNILDYCGLSRLQKVVLLSNDIFLTIIPHFCYDAGQFYEIEPGVHSWEKLSSIHATLYNWNSSVLPDAEYYFYFTLFQNPQNIHKSKLTVNNGQMVIEYNTSPLWIYPIASTSAAVSTNIDTISSGSTIDYNTWSTIVWETTSTTIFKAILFQSSIVYYSIMLIGIVGYFRRKIS